jgi:heat shock protein HslJ
VKRIRLFEIIGLLIILSLTAVACISSVGASNTGKLEGATWVLKSYGDPGNLKTVLPDKEATLIFEGGKKEIKGNAGINLYGGNYEVDGSKLTLTELFRTLMASTDEALNTQETAYFNILRSAVSYKIVGEALTITGTEGILVFRQR